MSERLTGPRAKYDRAAEHFDQIYAEIGAFRDRQPYRAFVEDDTATGDKVYRVEVREDPPQRLALMVGDCVHNLRSALDLLVWQLVEAGGGTPGNHTMFPITRSAKNFPSRMLACVAGADKGALRVLQALKPYKGGNDTLWRLHRLDANDKHKLLAVVGAAHRSIILTFTAPLLLGMDPKEMPSIPLDLIPADRQFPLKNGDEIFRVTAQVVEVVAGAPVQDEPQFTFEIALSDGEVVQGEPVITVLNELASTVDEVINLFTPFLK